MLRSTLLYIAQQHNKALESYLKTEISQSHECLWIATNKQTAADSQTTETIPSEIFENLWFFLCTSYDTFVKKIECRKFSWMWCRISGFYYLVNKDLKKGKCSQEDSMYWECYIICSNWYHLSKNITLVDYKQDLQDFSRQAGIMQNALVY